MWHRLKSLNQIQERLKVVNMLEGRTLCSQRSLPGGMYRTPARTSESDWQRMGGLPGLG